MNLFYVIVLYSVSSIIYYSINKMYITINIKINDYEKKKLFMFVS